MLDPKKLTSVSSEINVLEHLLVDRVEGSKKAFPGVARGEPHGRPNSENLSSSEKLTSVSSELNLASSRLELVKFEAAT